MISPRLLSFVGVLGLAGCAPSLSGRTYYPEYPESGDLLATNPCAVRREPEIVVRGSETERLEAAKSDTNYSIFFGKQSDEAIQDNARKAAEKGLATLRNANPAFLCGLERIEFLGNKAYAEAIPNSPTSFGYYDPADRILRIRLYGGLYPIVHEIGHHVHNLGYFAPAVREFLTQSWKWNDDGARVHKCEGSHCFLYDRAGEKPTEDWARTFENVLLHPTETLLKTNLNLEVAGRTALQRKVDAIFGITSLEKPVFGTVRIGAAQSLPHSAFQILAGSGLYLFDEAGATLTEYLLANGTFERTAHAPAKAGFLFDTLKSQELMDPGHASFLGLQTGGRLFLMGRESNFQPGLDRSAPLSLWELDTAGTGKLDAVAERHYLAGEVVLGGLTEVDGEAGYFSYAGEKLSLKTRAPGAKNSTERLSWPLPAGLTPIHVQPLGTGKGFAVLAHEKGSAGWEPTMTVLRLSRNQEKEGEFLQERGGSVAIQPEFWKNLRPPVRMGEFLVFPSYLEYGTTLGLLLYDLAKGRFFAPTFVTESLPEEFKKAAGRLESVQLATSGNQLYLIASVKSGPTLTAPIDLNLPAPSKAP